MRNDRDVERVVITPELAREWLGYNTHNRRLRALTVQQYASDIKSGDWQWNGESIKFAEDGTLLDGQHRLAAIVEAETAVTMLVVRGLPSETQDTVDGGVKRKFSDVLQLRGEPMYMTLAALVRKAAIWEAGGRKSIQGGGGAYPITNAVLVKFLEKNPDLRDAARYAGNANPRCFLPVSICALGFWLFSRIDAEDAEHFFARLHDGQNMAKGDPVYELRRVMETTKSMRGERSTTFITAITIKAWNAYRDGKTVMLLTFRPGGAKPEQFPEPH